MKKYLPDIGVIIYKSNCYTKFEKIQSEKSYNSKNWANRDKTCLCPSFCKIYHPPYHPRFYKKKELPFRPARDWRSLEYVNTLITVLFKMSGFESVRYHWAHPLLLLSLLTKSGFFNILIYKKLLSFIAKSTYYIHIYRYVPDLNIFQLAY